MSRLTYDRSANTLTLTGSDNVVIGTWTAHNNVTSTSTEWPTGTYTFSWYSRHAGANAESAYGSNGNFIFNVLGRNGMGVHAGRATTADANGNTGTRHVTHGCIRTTDAATQQIRATHATDQLTEIRVQE